MIFTIEKDLRFLIIFPDNKFRDYLLFEII